TANIGRIEGGRATNIIPDEVRVRGEARSHDLVRLAAQTDHMRACFEEAAARHPGARVEVQVEAAYQPMAVAEDSAIMQLAGAAGLGYTRGSAAPEARKSAPPTSPAITVTANQRSPSVTAIESSTLIRPRK